MRAPIAVLAAFAVLCLAVSMAAASEIQVEALVMSGSRNPTWIVKNEAEKKEIFSRVMTTPAATAFNGRMGYTGFVVHFLNRAGRSTNSKRIMASPDFELLLLNTGISAGALSHAVAMHIKQEIALLEKSPVLIVDNNVAPASPQCSAPVVGPDNETMFAPSTDDCGFFQTYQGDNNCYDYGTDVATNTFAQPGRGSGHKWDEDTCDSVRAAAERDGLIWNGTVLPNGNPSKGHFVALLIWPETNFHWVRLDSNMKGHWSHKPGGTPIRNTDNNGAYITDPSKCDLSPWSQFCGYMLVVPNTICTGSNHCIN
jgi:hypothetical protein